MSPVPNPYDRTRAGWPAFAHARRLALFHGSPAAALARHDANRAIGAPWDDEEAARRAEVRAALTALTERP